MLPVERRNQILRMLRTKGTIRVADLALEFGVTEETVRRDLDQLAQEGLVRRIHGGAVNPRGTGTEASILEREAVNADRKRQIGRAAVRLIAPGDTCALDASTTVVALAREISDINLTVVTNSISVVTALADRDRVTVIAVGGQLRRRALSLVGPIAEETIRRFRVDKVFLSSVAFHPVLGLSDSSLTEVEAKKRLVEVAREVIALVDSTKWGEVAFTQTVPIDAVDTVVTDAGAPPEMVQALRERGVEVIICGDADETGNGSSHSGSGREV